MLIRKEFASNLRSLIIWVSILSGFVILMLAIYPAFKDSFADVQEMLKLYPKEFLEIFYIGEGQLDMSSITGWFGMEGYLFVLLIGGAYSAIFASNIISKEEDEKTIEFLLAKPIDRKEVITSKLVVVVVNLILFNLIVSIITGISFAIFDTINFKILALLFVGPFLMQLTFASIALLISCFIVKSRKVLSISMGIVFGLYALDIVWKLSDKLSFLKYISPYEFVNALDIIQKNQIKPLYLLIMFVVITVNITATYYVYQRKDIYS